MLDWFKRGGGAHSGIFELYRILAHEARAAGRARAQSPPARSPGIGRMNMLHLGVPADGTVEMLHSGAESFPRAEWVRVD